MKRLQKYIVIFGSAMLCVGFSACSKQPDFDSQSYVKSSLDAEYHREYADYANLMEISEEDAKKQMKEDFNESIRQQFTSSDNITEEEIAAYTEKMAEVKKLAKYKVQDEKKDEDGNYTVSVKVEPSDVFQTLQQSSAEVSKGKIAQGMKETDPGVFAFVLMESAQKSIDKNSYGDPVTVSRGFFYKNETVRKEMDRALEQQVGLIDPKRYIGDIVLKKRIELLEQQIREMKREKEKLEKENIRLQKALNKKDLNLLKNL